MRTLEQKISDAGPNNQRIDPHILTEVRNDLLAEGRIVKLVREGYDWYHLPETDAQTIEDRYGKQEPIYRATRQANLSHRIGQALEIAVFRLLRTQSLNFFGHFPDLDSHDDDRRYKKIEPPSVVSGRELPGNKALDFLIASGESGFAGVEVKNTRGWIYPVMLRSLEELEFIKGMTHGLEIEPCPQGNAIEPMGHTEPCQAARGVDRQETMIALRPYRAGRPIWLATHDS